MSEAMSSVEIEDVLSSIRRLVSEDLRPSPKPVPAPKSDEKLLLTSALRVVVEKEVRPVQPEPAAPVSSVPMPRLHLGAGYGPDEMDFAPMRSANRQEGEWESEVGDPAPLVAQMEWTEDGWATVDGVSKTEAAVTSAADVPAWAQTEPDQDAEAVGAEGDDLEPADAIAGPDDIWADRAEAEAVAELRETEQDEPVALPGDDVTFDEQLLRDLVRDLIREELQGALGERITRNVRKLVRAEIARAIAAQDLE